MKKIVQKDDTVLREKAREVTSGEFGSAKLRATLADMATALAGEDDGVAIAAPQIGVSLRIFVLSPSLFSTDTDSDPLVPTRAHNEPLVYINPRIIKKSKTTRWLDEGCLSVRWLYGRVRRSTHATVEAQDENGTRFTRGASGLLAQIFQHETDHLDGVLFIDTAKDVKEIPPSEEN